MVFADLLDKTNHIYKINVDLIGTAQWCLENEQPEKGNFEQNISKCLYLLLNTQFYSELQILKTGICRFIIQS